MGIFSKKQKTVQNSLSTSRPFFFGRASSDVSVNERTAMQTAAVYACIRVLSEAVASLPLQLYKYHGAGSVIADDHPLYDILHSVPNAEMTSFVFRETLMGHLLLYGNAYAQIIRDGTGQIKELYPLLPDKMDVSRNEQGRIFYTYWPDKDAANQSEKGGGTVLRYDEVLHIPGLSFDGLTGYSPIALAKNVIGMAIATEDYGASFFRNGATPGGILEHPGKLNREAPEQMRDSWETLFVGKGAHRLAVLEDGLKYHAVGIPPDQAQFLETRRYQLNEIARIFRVPPHMIGDLERSTFSNIEQQALEFLKYSVEPWIQRWEQQMEKSLLSPAERKTHEIRFNVDGLLRGDYETRMNGFAQARQNGWMSANEIRGLDRLYPIPEELGGDKYYINGNMVEMGRRRDADTEN